MWGCPLPWRTWPLPTMCHSTPPHLSLTTQNVSSHHQMSPGARARGCQQLLYWLSKQSPGPTADSSPGAKAAGRPASQASFHGHSCSRTFACGTDHASLLPFPRVHGAFLPPGWPGHGSLPAASSLPLSPTAGTVLLPQELPLCLLPRLHGGRCGPCSTEGPYPTRLTPLFPGSRASGR